MFPDHLINLFIRKGISPETRRVIENIRNSEPSRRVGSGRGNTPGTYPSKKMGVTIQFESHTVELASVYEKEHDSRVYEYYDQPPSFTIRYQLNGRNSGRSYTADYFAIGEDFIGWEEWKTEEELIELSIKQPYLYIRAQDGSWYMPPAEEYAANYGLSFRVRSSKDIDWIYLSNIRFFEDYLLSESLQVENQAKVLLLNKVTDRPGISLKELLDDAEGYTSDDVYKLIVSDELYFNMRNSRITAVDKARIYCSKEMETAYSYIDRNPENTRLQTAQVQVSPGNTVNWDGRAFVILNTGETSISLLSQDSDPKEISLPHESFQFLVQQGKISGLTASITEQKQEVLDILKNASPAELANATNKYELVKMVMEGTPASILNVSERTLRDWVAKYKKAEQKYGYGYIGLLRTKKPGNRVRRFSKELLELIDKSIDDNFATIVNRKAYTVWKLLVADCGDKGYEIPSFRSFLVQIKKRSDYELTLKREGKKAAYSKEPRYLELHLTTPRHGEYPFEVCHLDHTQLDIELICSRTKKNLGRPWATFLVDAFTRRLLAIYLTFDEPGYRSNMMVLRECVKRHSRLPKNIIVDGGKEFASTYFETLLAFYNVGKKLRVGKPKHGTVVERLFGTTNTEFIENLLGNTQVMKNFRQVTQAVNPKLHAVWTFSAFQEKLKEWAYNIYDTIEHPALGRTPREEFLAGIAASGKRVSTHVTYNETFIMMTLPTTKKGTAKLDPSNGVKINHIYYWSESLLDPEYAGRQVPVRYDPFNMGVAYAYIRNTWVYLNSEHFAIFADRTEKEVQQALEELKRRMRLRGEEVIVSAVKLAKFLKSAEAEEVLLLQRLKDSEVKSTFTVHEGGNAKKVSPESSTNSSKQTSRNNFTVHSNEHLTSKRSNSVVSKEKGLSTAKELKNKYRNFGEF